jgi:predicted nucleic acid-binding protein
LIVTFDTNVLVYATASIRDAKVLRARELLTRALKGPESILILQTLAEFANVAIRKAGIPVKDIQKMIDAWRAVLPVQIANDEDLTAALDAVGAHRLPFWDAMLWASAQRAGVRYLLTEDLQDGLVLKNVTFVNPFEQNNTALIDRVLPII